MKHLLRAPKPELAFTTLTFLPLAMHPRLSQHYRKATFYYVNFIYTNYASLVISTLIYTAEIKYTYYKVLHIDPTQLLHVVAHVRSKCQFQKSGSEPRLCLSILVAFRTYHLPKTPT